MPRLTKRIPKLGKKRRGNVTYAVVRLNNRTSSRFSRAATALDKAVGDMPSSCAAARKLPRRATAMMASSSVRPDLCIIPIFEI